MGKRLRIKAMCVLLRLNECEIECASKRWRLLRLVTNIGA